jgi:hypothetical protein
MIGRNQRKGKKKRFFPVNRLPPVMYDLLMKFPGFLPRRFSRRFAAGVPVLVLGIMAGVFFCRSPVLVLSDAIFDALYGPRRALIRQTGLSLRLFRQVKRVMIAENANPEATVFAIEEKEKRPWVVLGPARYSRGLEQYARQHPDVWVSIVQETAAPLAGGDNTAEAEQVFPDTRLNSWRAGCCAALLAGETTGTVLIFQDAQDFPVNRQAFLAGLQRENENLTPVYLNSASDYPFWDRVRLVVLGGPANFYLDRRDAIPAILYSWTDPALSSSAVKVIIDDSLWAAALQSFHSPDASRTAAADFRIPWGRIGEGELKKKLKRAFLAEIPAGSPW